MSAAGTLRSSFRDYIDRVKGGDVGSLPAVLGLVVLVVIFSIMRPETFTNSFNFANLINQSAAVMVIAMGLVFVLLLGEIDLAAGYTAGVCGAMLGVVVTNHGWPWWAGILVALLTGVVIGTSFGLMVAYVGIPSFVVTLAAFLAFQGVLLVIIGEGGTIAYRDETILAIMNKNMPVWLGWTLWIVGMAAFAFISFRRNEVLRRANLKHDPQVVWLVKFLALTAITGAGIWYLSIERSRNVLVVSLKGVPIVVVLLTALLLVLTFVLSRTGWGRHVYAIGGNAEAARRAGIDVRMVKLSCFAMCSDRGGDRRHPPRQPQQLDLACYRRLDDAAARRRRGRHRRHQPLRRQGQGVRRGRRWARRRRDPERHAAAGPTGRQRLHRDRNRASA